SPAAAKSRLCWPPIRPRSPAGALGWSGPRGARFRGFLDPIPPPPGRARRYASRGIPWLDPPSARRASASLIPDEHENMTAQRPNGTRAGASAPWPPPAAIALLLEAGVFRLHIRLRSVAVRFGGLAARRTGGRLRLRLFRRLAFLRRCVGIRRRATPRRRTGSGRSDG